MSFFFPLSLLFDFAGVRDANYALEAATNHRAFVGGVRARARTHVNSFARIHIRRVSTHRSRTHARSVFVLNNPWNVGGKKKTKFRGVSSKRVSLVKSPTDDEALKKFRQNDDVEKEN